MSSLPPCNSGSDSLQNSFLNLLSWNVLRLFKAGGCQRLAWGELSKWCSLVCLRWEFTTRLGWRRKEARRRKCGGEGRRLQLDEEEEGVSSPAISPHSPSGWREWLFLNQPPRPSFSRVRVSIVMMRSWERKPDANALALFNDRPESIPQVFPFTAPLFTSYLTLLSLSLHTYKMGFIELLEVNWML